jgi:hypothetical protein
MRGSVDVVAKLYVENAVELCTCRCLYIELWMWPYTYGGVTEADIVTVKLVCRDAGEAWCLWRWTCSCRGGTRDVEMALALYGDGMEL